MLEARVILVHYRCADLVRARVRELRASPERPAEIVVVDNDPAAGLPRGLDGLDAEVRWIPMPRNAGFAAAVNRGMEGLVLPFALWLNPDARPDPGCLEGLQETLEGTPAAAVAAPALYPAVTGFPAEPCATRRDPCWRSLLLEYAPLGKPARKWLAQQYFLTAGAGTEPIPCAAVQGACFLVRREAWKAVGPLDAGRFFLYWEETDFCRRARAEGWTVLFCPRRRCVHEGGASVASGRQDTEAFWRSADAYFRKYHGAFHAGILRGTVLAGTAAHLAVLGLSRLLRPSRRAGKEAFMNLLKARWKVLRALSRKGGAGAS